MRYPGGRKKSLCCTPNGDAVLEMKCNLDLCMIDPTMCEDFLTSDDSSLRLRDRMYDQLDDEEEEHLVVRSYVSPFDGLEYSYLEDRAGKVYPGLPRPLSVNMGGVYVRWLSRAYPATVKKLFGGDGSSTVPIRGAFQ